MKFEPVITLGTIIHLVTLIIAIASFYFSLKSDIKDLKFKVDMIWRWYKKEHGINGDGEITK
jgi:hypothetical protein